MTNNLILPIYGRYAYAILRGDKTVEFRKFRPPVNSDDKIYMVITDDTATWCGSYRKMNYYVPGYFTVSEAKPVTSLKRLREIHKLGCTGCKTFKELADYYRDSIALWAWDIGSVFKFEQYVDIGHILRKSKFALCSADIRRRDDNNDTK